MSYEAWRISFQSSEQAARAAWQEAQQLRIEVGRLRDGLLMIVEESFTGEIMARNVLDGKHPYQGDDCS